MRAHSKLPHTCAPARAEPDLSLFDAALWHANYKGQDGVVEILLAAGADATIRPKLTQPPLVVMQGVTEKIERLQGIFTTEPVRDYDHVLDNKTAFVVGVPDAAVGGPAFLKRHAPLTQFMFEVGRGVSVVEVGQVGRSRTSCLRSHCRRWTAQHPA